MTDTKGLKLKVIELGEFAAAPYCARLLADFGAEVIKVERPGTGDTARQRGPFLMDRPDGELSGMFLYLNSNKKGITLDIETADGQALFKKLIAEADVVIEDREPGVMDRLGLGWEALAQINPRLIMASITPFGQTGPYANFKARPINTYHASGAGYMLPMNSTSLDREPVRGPAFLGEYDGGMNAAVAILAALHWRRSSGKGQHVDVATQHAMMHLERSQLRRYIDTGNSPNRTGMGRLLESLVRCKDGNYVILILSSQKQWEGLYEAMGRPEWGQDEKFLTQASRSQNYPELRDRLADWASQYDAQDVFETVQEQKSACAPAYTAEQFYNSPQIISREYLREIEHPIAGTLRYPGLPYKFSDMPEVAVTGAPILGQDNDAVLAEGVGVEAEDMVRLRQAGVI